MSNATREPEIRLAIVGCGAIVEKIHARALAYLIAREPIRVVAALDLDPARSTVISARFPGCICVDKLTDLPLDVNLALVASPVKFHAQQTIELLGRGIHVLCEKPMALSSLECAEMIRAAEHAGRLLAVGHVRRFYPVSQQVRSIVLNRALGRALSFRMIEGSRYQWGAVSDAYFRRESGGGALRDVGVHLIDLLLWWFNEPLGVKYQDDAMGGVEANANILLSYEEGLTGKVLLSRDWNLRERCFIHFERGWVAWRPNDPNHLDVGLSPEFALRSTVHEQVPVGDEPVPGPSGARFQQAFILQLLNVARAVAGREPLLVPGEEAARSIELLESCYRSRHLMQMPWMSEQELARARTLT